MDLDDLDIPDIMNRIDSAIDEIHDRATTKIIAEQEYKGQNDMVDKINNVTETLKEPLERQLEAVESIADSAKKTANSADVKSWIAIIISALALFLELFLNRAEIINFISSFFQK